MWPLLLLGFFESVGAYTSEKESGNKSEELNGEGGRRE